VNRVLWIVPLLLPAAAGCFSEERWEYGVGEGDPFASDAEWMPAQPPAERTGNVTMVVERIAVSRQDQTDLEAAWRYVDEHVAVGGGQLARRNGVRVGVATGGFRGALQTAVNKSRSREVQKATLTVLSGAAGMIRVGQNTYVEALRYRTPRGQTVLLERTFVGASLVAPGGDVDRGRGCPRPADGDRGARSVLRRCRPCAVLVAAGAGEQEGDLDRHALHPGSAVGDRRSPGRQRDFHVR